jgi:hypothetical protein
MARLVTHHNRIGDFLSRESDMECAFESVPLSALREGSLFTCPPWSTGFPTCRMERSKVGNFLPTKGYELTENLNVWASGEGSIFKAVSQHSLSAFIIAVRPKIWALIIRGKPPSFQARELELILNTPIRKLGIWCTTVMFRGYLLRETENLIEWSTLLLRLRTWQYITHYERRGLMEEAKEKVLSRSCKEEYLWSFWGHGESHYGLEGFLVINTLAMDSFFLSTRWSCL